MILSSGGYSDATTGIVTIGTSGTSFLVWTIPDPSGNSLSRLTFTDTVSSGRVTSDTIALVASGNASPIRYKFVSTPGDCTNTGMLVYT